MTNPRPALAPTPPPAPPPIPSTATNLPIPPAPDTVPKRDELQFHGSDEPSLGVEIELPVLDHESGDLVPGAPRIIQACAEESIPNVGAEIMQSMLEVRTGICRNVADVRDQLLPTLRRARNIASSLGYDLALLGTHPFLRPNTSTISSSERYESLMIKLAWMTYYRVTFGLHIHVGMKSGDQAIGVMNAAMRYLPHLLAASANSPFWAGVDTGLASSRAVLYSMVPHSGVPIMFSRWKEFRSYYQIMHEGQALGSFKDIKWDLRPRPDLGTLEFRVCDMPLSLSGVLALVALTRSLVISSQRLLAERPHLTSGDRRRSWITVENRWLAARHGLKALAIRTHTGKRRAWADDLTDLVGKVMPLAAESGDDRFLTPLSGREPIESGADHQRQLYRQAGNWKAVMDDAITRFNRDLDKMAPAPVPQPATA